MIRRSFSGGLPSAVEERLLLYLNKDTWRGEDGIELAEIVRAAWEHQVDPNLNPDPDPNPNLVEVEEQSYISPISPLYLPYISPVPC